MASASIPPRPYRTPEIAAAAVEGILKYVVGWAPRRSENAIRADLIRCADDDAYRFARDLEDRCGWSSDAELVEVLDEVDLWAARHEAVKKWVAQHGVAIPFSVGDLIEYVTISGEKTFRVVALDAETAEVVAQPVPPDPEDPDFGETGGWIIPAERARLAPSTAEAPAPS